VRGGDQAAGDPVGHHRAQVAADDVEAQVDAAAHPGGGQDVALVDVEDVALHRHGGELAREGVDVLPVGGGVQPVEHAGRGQREGPGADGHDPPALPVGLGERLEDGRRPRGGRLGARHDQGVGRPHLRHPARRHCREAPSGAHPPVDGADGGLVRGLRPGGEDLCRDRQVEGHHPVQGQDRDPVNRHGNILAKAGNLA
jgi:hypothetical protein